MSASTRFLLYSLLAGLALRAGLVGLAAWDPTVPPGDSPIYLGMAGNLIRHWDLGYQFGTERMPVYPLFLAVCHQLTGLSLDGNTLPGRSLVTVLIVQNILGMTSVYVLHRLGALFSRTTADLCAGFAALNLNMILYSNQILTEALFYPLMVLALYVFLLYRRTGGPVRLAVLGALLGFGVLVRSVNMYLLLFLVPYLLLEWDRGGLGPRLKRVALFCAMFGLFVLPWMGRNLYLYGHAGLTTQGEYHLRNWVLPMIMQNQEGLSYTEATAASAEAWDARLEAMPPEERRDPFARDAEAKAMFLDYVREAEPAATATAWFWGAVKNLFTPVAVEVANAFQMPHTGFSDSPGAGAPEQAWNFLAHNENGLYAALIALGVAGTLLFRLVQAVGFFVLARRWPGALAICLLLAVYYLAVSGPVGYAKYRLPFEAVFVLLTAQGAGLLPVFRGGRAPAAPVRSAPYVVGREAGEDARRDAPGGDE
ncbi:ArnT family glycosyltransferase [Desulfocurvus sp. DL9XJH121]